jgi:hypothetical protein
MPDHHHFPADTDGCITMFVPGKRFADVGGLWGVVNEKITVALRAGAKTATMIDIEAKDSPSWTAFDAHAQKMGVSGYEKISADASSPDLLSIGRAFDVVHCSGVVYHVPSPHSLILNLRRLTREFLILTSMTIPDLIRNSAGSLDLRGGMGLYVPALNGPTKEILKVHFEERGLDVHAITGDHGHAWFDHGVPHFGPWWWLLTPYLLKSLVESVGFEILSMHEPWAGQSTAVVARKKPD